jgi:hypothetical protein
MIWLIVALIIAYLVDAYIRKYLVFKSFKDIENVYNNAFLKRMQQLEQVWTQQISIYMSMHGLAGNVNVSTIDPETQFDQLGKKIHLKTGVVKERVCSDADTALDNLVKIIKSNPDYSFTSTSDFLHDKYYVVFYIQDTLQELFYESKKLYDNVEVGDLLNITMYNDEIVGVGFMLKGEQDGKDDVGAVQKSDRGAGSN